ncbi:MAG: sigma-70 family RNA polymerase sigma factor [Sphingomonadales bacterium]|jgi:RNA polymerase sigma-70 factor (ECF subfamily)
MGDSNFEEYIDLYGPLVARIVASYEASTILRQDLMQEIWLKVWRGMAKYRGEGSQKAFIAQIARNHCISHVAQMARRPKHTVVDENDPSPHANPEMETDAALRRKRLEQMVQNLPLEQREVVVLILEGFTHREVATSLSLSENAVTQRFKRAKATLMDAMR